MNGQTLELQIKSKAQEAKTSIDGLVKSLTNVEGILTNIYLELGHIEKKADSSISKTNKSVNDLKSSANKTVGIFGSLKKALSLGGAYLGAKKLTAQMLGWTGEAIDFTEQLNLFNVVFDNIEKSGVKTFSELGKSATRFQYKLNEAFGTNKTETLYMQGIFQSMGETVGIGDKYSAIMSETMTKLTYDLASLFNKQETATAEAIRAGVYAGQTKPLRSYGIDVTQQSLQPILDSLGIEKQVKEMSQAEKEILRYLATLKQAQIAMGDLANTIESPSNQLKVFRQQLVEAKVAFSSFFIGTFGQALPYANAILMVIKEISKSLASLFGIKLEDYNTGIASQEGIYDGLSSSIDGATKKAKELKKQIFGWDEIHNIDDSKNNGDGGSVITGGIDQRLLDSIKSYDNGMDKVRMKATEIRDRIMEWLGFTKEIDPLTGEVSFKLKEGWTNIKKIATAIEAIIVFLAGKKIFAFFMKIITFVGKITSAISGGATVVGATLGALASPISTTAVAVGLLLTGLGLITAGLAIEFAKPAIKQFDELGNASTKTREKLEPVIDKFDELDLAIDSINYSHAVMTDEQAKEILKKIDDTFDTVKQEIIKQKAEAIQEINDLARKTGLSDNDKEKLINEQEKYYESALEQLADYKQRYIEIVENARKENRELTAQELSEIYDIQNESQKLSIESLSGSADEAKAIYDDVCKNAKAKSAEQASEIIKNTAETRNKTVEEAKKQRDETLAQIAMLKTDGSAESEALKQKMIDNANKIYEETVESAKKMHQDTYDEFVRQNQDIAKYIDSDSGKIKSNWNIFCESIENKFSSMKNGVVKTWNTLWDFLSKPQEVKIAMSQKNDGSSLQVKAVRHNADGGIYSHGVWKNIEQYANGGAPSHGSVFVAGERGAEIVGHINGKTEVLNQSQLASAIYNAVVSAMSQNSGGGIAEINVHADSGIIVETAIKGINQETNQTGVCPINIPGY